MSNDYKLTVRLPRDLHRQVKAKAVLADLTLSEVVRGLLELWQEGKIDLPDLDLEQGGTSQED